MATLTIRNLPETVVERLKEVAAKNGRSMESEVRDLLEQRYVSRAEILERIRQDAGKYPAPTARQVRKWIRAGRDRRLGGL